MRVNLLLFVPALLLLPMSAAGQAESTPVMVENLQAHDSPNDAGGAVELTWELSEGTVFPDSITVLRESPDGEMAVVGTKPGVSSSHIDTGLENGVDYTYSLRVHRGGSVVERGPVSAAPSAQWLHGKRWGMLLILVILTGFIVYFIEQGKKGRELYIREIAGLAAVEDAVGRATEMGRPVLYVPGIMDMDNIQTIASMVILGRVAARTAKYGSPLLVPVSKSVVLSVSQEVVKEAYLEEGRPDAYESDNIFYLTDDQFGYAAGVDGVMVRERPAAIFLLGTFYAESLILAETGRSVGAIQIAGTAMPSQLPFFIAACDYTLIGEELFAASAYLSREPKLLGSLKGQDVAKLFFILVITVGVLAATLGVVWEQARPVAEFIRSLTHVE